MTDDLNEGTAVTPYMTFSEDQDCGMFFSSPGTVHYCVDGIEVTQKEFLLHCAKTGKLSQMYLIANDLGLAPFQEVKK